MTYDIISVEYSYEFFDDNPDIAKYITWTDWEETKVWIGTIEEKGISREKAFYEVVTSKFGGEHEVILRSREGGLFIPVKDIVEVYYDYNLVRKDIYP